jgi:cellulose synthase/poly-beta-1,6-N-acetylglucosamine synthase-like glycosyltransferase
MNIYDIILSIGLIYAVLYTSSKIIFSLLSLIQIKKYTKKYDHIATNEEVEDYVSLNRRDKKRILPKVTIVSPAYNEGVLIKDTVRSFLNQSYPETEVIIASDSGTDNTLEVMIEEFELYEVDGSIFTHSDKITHKPIKRYFKSKSFDNLIVLDKENGGKADSQNAGISISSGIITTIIDADSVLERNALYHLVSVFEREDDVIGIGTPIGALNDSNVGDDGVEDGTIPKSFWAKIQVLEYLRSFLLGRMAFQRYRGLAMVSGAFGVYYKWVIEEVGGYHSGSLAEDMDIDCKVWRMLDDKKLPFRIRYVPEVFCWSEVPSDLKNLKSQRDRWSRGLTETMWKNKDLFMNPKYGVLGLFSYPYYLFFEWFTPFLEIFGFIFLHVTIITGNMDWHILITLFFLYWASGLFLNGLTIYAEAKTGGHYKNKKSLYKLIFIVIIEPLFYHWVNSAMYVWGNIRLLFGARGWGSMDRTGIKKDG